MTFWFWSLVSIKWGHWLIESDLIKGQKKRPMAPSQVYDTDRLVSFSNIFRLRSHKSDRCTRDQWDRARADSTSSRAERRSCLVASFRFSQEIKRSEPCLAVHNWDHLLCSLFKDARCQWILRSWCRVSSRRCQ